MSEAESINASRRNWIMLCIMLGLTLSSMGSAIVNIALPNISRSFGSSDAATVWVVNSYQLAATVCLLPVASLCETLGLKRVYATGLTLFVVASLACAAAPTLPLLVIARLFQGIGAGAVSVAGMAVVRVIYPSHMVSKGLAMVALAVAVPGALGPTVAAGILAVADWPWLFLVNVPFALAIPLFIRTAPTGIRTARPFDLAGAILNALALGLFVMGVGTLGLGDWRVATAEIVVGLICLQLFFMQQRKKTIPMLPFDLFRIPLFTLSVWTSVCSYSAQILAYVSLPFMFEQDLHLSTVATGLLLTPWPFMTAVTAPIAGRLTNRCPASIICTVGLALMAIGLLCLALMPADPAKWDVAWRLALGGIGFGLFQTPNNTAMMTAGPVARSGAASGMNAVARYMGWSFGSALVSLILGFSDHGGPVYCLYVAMGFAVVGAVTSSLRRFR